MQYASQYDRMKEHFLDGKQLTRMEALNDLGIMNPTARVSELRANGFDIQTRMIGVYNRWDTKVKVAQWFLPDEDKPLVPTRKNRR
jgi:hypothetical protein